MIATVVPASGIGDTETVIVAGLAMTGGLGSTLNARLVTAGSTVRVKLWLGTEPMPFAARTVTG